LTNNSILLHFVFFNINDVWNPQIYTKCLFEISKFIKYSNLFSNMMIPNRYQVLSLGPYVVDNLM